MNEPDSIIDTSLESDLNNESNHLSEQTDCSSKESDENNDSVGNIEKKRKKKNGMKRRQKKRKQRQLEPGELDQDSSSNESVENLNTSKKKQVSSPDDILVSDSSNDVHMPGKNSKNKSAGDWVIDLTCESPPKRRNAEESVSWANYDENKMHIIDDSDDCIIESVDLTALNNKYRCRERYSSSEYSDSSSGMNSYKRQPDIEDHSDSEDYNNVSRRSTPSPNIVKDHLVLRAKQTEVTADAGEFLLYKYTFQIAFVNNK